MANFFYWYYGLMPRLFVRAGRGLVRQSVASFSLRVLARTLFAPWRRDVESTDGLSLLERGRVLVDNLLSRMIGAVIRSATLIAGCLVVGLQTIVFSLITLLWYLLPLVSVLFIGYGIRLFAGGN